MDYAEEDRLRLKLTEEHQRLSAKRAKEERKVMDEHIRHEKRTKV